MVPEKELDSSPFLHIVHLSVAYDGQNRLGFKKKAVWPAVKDVCLKLEHGKSHAVVGESGCGKTSLGLAILRFVTPTAGKIFFQGRDLQSLSAQEMFGFRRQVQPVFQDAGSSLNPRHKIFQTLWLASPKDLTQTEKREKITAITRDVGLTPEILDRYPHQLSGGQQQRVCLARALLPDPRLLILDEPVSSQDISIQSQLIQLLLKMKAKFKLTYLIISHDLRVVHCLADEVSVMRQGCFVETASREQMFNHPQAAYTRSLLENREFVTPNER